MKTRPVCYHCRNYQGFGYQRNDTGEPYGVKIDLCWTGGVLTDYVSGEVSRDCENCRDGAHNKFGGCKRWAPIVVTRLWRWLSWLRTTKWRKR